MGVVAIKDIKKEEFHKNKNKRIERQKNRLNKIQELPKEDWAEKILDFWKEELPNYVLDELMKQNHFDVIDECFEFYDYKDKVKEMIQIISGISDELKAEEAAAIYNKVRQEYYEDHKTNIDNIVNFLKTLPSPTTITITSNDIPLLVKTRNVLRWFHVNDLGSLESVMDEDISIAEQLICEMQRQDVIEVNKSNNYLLEGIICAMLESGARSSIMIRHPLTLKVLREDENGEMKWTHQDKVMAIMIEDEKIIPLNVSNLRDAYCTDSQTGEWIGMDVGTHLGDTQKEFHKFMKER